MSSISIGIVRVRTTVERVVAIEDAGKQERRSRYRGHGSSRRDRPEAKVIPAFR